MPQQKLSLSYNDVERGILELSLEDQLKLTEIIFTNLKAALGYRPETEVQGDDLSQFCGKWLDDRDAEEIVSQIYTDRVKNVRSERVVL